MLSAPLPRLAGDLLQTAATVSPVVVMMGARQTGKSTLVQQWENGSERPYFTLDDLATRQRAERQPEAFLASHPSMILDEVQRVPGLLLAVKKAVDEERPRRPGRFLLTGSANLLLMEKVSETLAGRATYVPLWPFTVAEKRGLGRAGRWDELFALSASRWHEWASDQRAEPVDWRTEVMRGSYPIPALELSEGSQRALWYEGYLRTYLERDLQDLASIDNLIDFRRLMRVACLRLGSLVNQAELGRDIQLSRPTTHRYLNLLETSFQLVRLEPYSVNRTKRLVKTPKLFWSDPGLAHHLSGAAELSGAALESLILLDLLAWQDSKIPRPEVLFWRTATGHEVDFVIEQAGGLLPIEVKASSRPGWGDTRGVREFLADYGDRCPGGLVLHGGETIEWLAENVLSLPWWLVAA
ncbi:MAG: ATP-binding protein [Acidobacteriota bacterium]